MERYPEYRLTCSQAQQYKWLEQLYPKLFERVKEKVLSGQFHTIGGSWVENDGNMPSGEALTRQLLFGQRYFESRFGKRCDSAWLVALSHIDLIASYFLGFRIPLATMVHSLN